MSAPAPPKVDCERQHPRLVVGDMEEALKARHGIEYDVHASYRFEEG